MDNIIGLRDQNYLPIIDLDADWTTKDYELGLNKHLCIQLGWDNAALEGDVFLDYSAEQGNDSDGVSVWTVKSAVNLDGTFQEVMFLDSNLAIGSFRLRFTHTLGSANMTANITRKV